MLIRTFLPGQYRDNFLGSIGPFQVTATIPSTLTTASGSAVAAAVTGSSQSLAALLQRSDIVVGVIPVVPQTAGVAFSATITANGTLWITAVNGSAGTYNPGILTFTIFALRLKADI